MGFSFPSVLPSHWRKVSCLILAYFWIIGIFCGVWISCQAGGPLFSAMRRAVFTPVSIISLLPVAILPFLFSAVVVFLSGPAWLYLLTFLDGVLYGAVSFAAYCSFGDAGWLIRPVLCFSMFATAPMSYLFRLRHVSGERVASFSEVLFFLSFAVLIGSFDYSYVSPLLAKLIS